MAADTKYARLKDILDNSLGEAIHAGFRKGIDCPGAHEIYAAIEKLPDEEYAKYVKWVRWSIYASAGIEK